MTTADLRPHTYMVNSDISIHYQTQECDNIQGIPYKIRVVYIRYRKVEHPIYMNIFLV